MGRSSDLDQMSHVGRYGGHNHVWNISWLSVKGCGCGERGKCAFSNWLDASPLPCDRVISRSPFFSSRQYVASFWLVYGTDYIHLKVANFLCFCICVPDNAFPLLVAISLWSSNEGSKGVSGGPFFGLSDTDFCHINVSTTVSRVRLRLTVFETFALHDWSIDDWSIVPRLRAAVNMHSVSKYKQTSIVVFR